MGLPNYTKALELYKLSAEQDYDMAQIKMGKYYDSINNVDDCLKWYKLAAEQNNSESQCILGLLYKKYADIERENERENEREK